MQPEQTNLTPENTQLSRDHVKDLVDQGLSETAIRDIFAKHGYSEIEINKLSSDLHTYSNPSQVNDNVVDS